MCFLVPFFKIQAKTVEFEKHAHFRSNGNEGVTYNVRIPDYVRHVEALLCRLSGRLSALELLGHSKPPTGVGTQSLLTTESFGNY